MLLFKYSLFTIIISIGCTANLIVPPAITVAQVSSVIESEGKGLLEMARTEIKRNNYPEAIKLLKKALVFFEKKGDLRGQAQTLFQLGKCSSRLNEYSQAIEYYQQELKIVRQLGDRATAGKALNNLGIVSGRLGKYSEAIDYYQQSLTIARQLGNRTNEGNALHNLGSVSQRLRRYSEAIDYFQQALKIARQLGNRTDEGNTLSSLGTASRSLRKYSEAIKYYQQALKIARQLGDILDEGNALRNLGSVSQRLRRYPQAIDYFQQALKIARQLGDRATEGSALSNLGIVSKELGKYPEAIYYNQQALKIDRQLGNRHGEGTVLNNLGVVYQSLGKYPEAINYLQQALKIAHQLGDRLDEGNILNNIGVVYQSLRKYSEATDYHQQALKVARQLGDRLDEGKTLGNLGTVYYKLHQLPIAINYLQQATNIHDSLRTNLKDQDKVSIFQNQIKSYKLLAAASWLNQDLPGSLIATERGRARAFSDLLSQRLEANPAIVKPNTLDFAQIQTQARSRQATIVSYSILPDFDHHSPKPHKLLIHVISPTGKLSVRESLLPKNIQLAQLVDNNRTQLIGSRSQRRFTIDQLKPGMLVRIEGDSESETKRRILAINAQKQTVVLQGIGQDPNETEERAFSEITGLALSTEHPKLRQLHQILIEPIVDLLLTNPLTPVIFIPDGELYEVPFAALENAQHQYLIDLHPISVAPSISILAQTARLKQRNIPTSTPSLVIGNPDFSQHQGSYQQLRFSDDEAREVARLFPSQLLLGNAATESAVKRWLPSARIAHFATHGFRDSDNALNSGIVLTPSGADSGILTAEKVLNLNLHADLVVLSACNTGRGKITGDGVIGLSRSFITAGAASTIVSLWSIDDRATSVLMSEFYRQWRGGKSKTQALRDAMLKTKAQYPDPYFWSSMSLYGEID